MRRIFGSSILIYLGFITLNPASADILNVTSDGTNYTVQKYDISSGTATDLKTFTSPYGTCAGCTFMDEYEGKLYLGGASGWAIYDVESNTVDLVDKPALMSEILDAVSRNITLPEPGSIRLAETIDFGSLAAQPMPFELDALTDILVPEEDWAEQRGRSTLKSSALSTVPDFLFSKRGFQVTVATSGLIALAHLLS